MKKHLFGAVLFCAIVGTTAFCSYYFLILPEILPGYQSLIYDKKAKSQIEIERRNSRLVLSRVRYHTKHQKITADVKGSWSDTDGEVMLHFFLIRKNSPEFLFTANTSPGIAANYTIITQFVEIESFTKMKSFQNIYVIVESDRSYKQNPIPTFVPELAVPITIYKD